MDLKKTTTLAYLAFKALNGQHIDNSQELDKILAFEDTHTKARLFETLPAEYNSASVLMPSLNFYFADHEKVGHSTVATASIPFLHDGQELRFMFSAVENDVEEEPHRVRIFEIALISVAPADMDTMVLFRIKRRDTNARAFGNIELFVQDCLPDQDLRDKVGITLDNFKRKELVDVETRNFIDVLIAALFAAEEYDN